jgi:hypothetical protein
MDDKGETDERARGRARASRVGKDLVEGCVDGCVDDRWLNR